MAARANRRRAVVVPVPLPRWMVDRLVDAVRLYADDDDGGGRVRDVGEQWIDFRGRRTRVASGGFPPEKPRGPAVTG